MPCKLPFLNIPHKKNGKLREYEDARSLSEKQEIVNRKLKIVNADLDKLLRDFDEPDDEPEEPTIPKIFTVNTKPA